MKEVIQKVQVNVPFTMLVETWMDTFLSLGLNPEIGIDAVSLETYSKSEFKNIADRFHDAGRRITVHGPFMDLSPASPDPGIRELSIKRYDQLLEVIPVLKPVTVVGHCGYDKKRHHLIMDEWFEGTVDFWGRVAAALKGYGVALMLENVYEEHPDEILSVVAALDTPGVGVCLDVGHMNVFSTASLSTWLETLGSHIGQLHLHDNKGDFDLHLPVGEGVVDFRRVFGFVDSKRPVLTLEPHEEQDLYRSLAYLNQHHKSSFC